MAVIEHKTKVRAMELVGLGCTYAEAAGAYGMSHSLVNEMTRQPE